LKVISKRIKQARKYIGVSQAAFGEMAGLDNREANVKMSQYESQGIDPKYQFVLKLASAARLPEFFFYIESDELAETLLEAVSTGKEWVYSPQ
jgi:transcriptional regulator with XRE-family HTH domain